MPLSQRILFSDSSLFTKIMYQNYIKIHKALRNQKYILRLPKLVSEVRFARKDLNRSFSHVHTLFVNILGGFWCLI